MRPRSGRSRTTAANDAQSRTNGERIAEGARGTQRPLRTLWPIHQRGTSADRAAESEPPNLGGRRRPDGRTAGQREKRNGQCRKHTCRRGREESNGTSAPRGGAPEKRRERDAAARKQRARKEAAGHPSCPARRQQETLCQDRLGPPAGPPPSAVWGLPRDHHYSRVSLPLLLLLRSGRHSTQDPPSRNARGCRGNEWRSATKPFPSTRRIQNQCRVPTPPTSSSSAISAVSGI